MRSHWFYDLTKATLVSGLLLAALTLSGASLVVRFSLFVHYYQGNHRWKVPYSQHYHHHRRLGSCFLFLLFTIVMGSVHWMEGASLLASSLSLASWVVLSCLLLLLSLWGALPGRRIISSISISIIPPRPSRIALSFSFFCT